MTDEPALAAMLIGSSWHRRALEAIAASDASDAWMTAGAIRDLVWDERFGTGFDPAGVKDVDVAFFDPGNLSPARDHQVEAALTRLAPEFPWEAKNQAAVHEWYPRRFGFEVEPFASIEDAVAANPETATAVAARLGADGVEILAPLGLSDLFAGVWRRNPRRVSAREAAARIEHKQPATRWPGVRVIPP